MTGNNYKSIAIIQRPGEITGRGAYVLREVLLFAKKIGVPVTMPDEERDYTNNTLFIAIGGDGTMLKAFDESVKYNTGLDRIASAVVGFNTGTLGFLTEDSDHETIMLMLNQIFSDSRDKIKYEDRMALQVELGGIKHFAINEFMFAPSNIASSLRYQIDINDGFVAKHMGSGVLVATSTGSTAMAMSAGGAIISPSTNVMQIVPIVPHTLTSRPIITTGRDTITITSDMERVNHVSVSSDGREIFSFDKDAKIVVKKAMYPVRVWYTKDRDFFNILSTKLKW